MWQPNDLFWSRYLAGELGCIEAIVFRYRLYRMPQLKKEYDAIRAQRKAFDADVRRTAELEQLLANAGELSAPRRRSTWLLTLSALPVGAAALLLVFMMPASEQRDVLTAKGGDTFVLLSRRVQTISALGRTCHAGDALRGKYRTDRKYLMVVGLDTSGVMQVLFPMNGSRSVRLDSTEGVTPGSWVLDEQPGTERFFAIFSDEPVTAQAVSSELRGNPDKPLRLQGSVIVEHRCTKQQEQAVP